MLKDNLCVAASVLGCILLVAGLAMLNPLLFAGAFTLMMGGMALIA